MQFLDVLCHLPSKNYILKILYSCRAQCPPGSAIVQCICYVKFNILCYLKFYLLYVALQEQDFILVFQFSGTGTIDFPEFLMLMARKIHHTNQEAALREAFKGTVRVHLMPL